MFPRADIHELIAPDILHQLIKGTFKEHIVKWIEDYIKQTHTAAEAKRVMDDIDRRYGFHLSVMIALIIPAHRIAAVPNFPGLRRFPEGRKFKQWTGNDSKALMKV